jgi:MFS family permease
MKAFTILWLGQVVSLLGSAMTWFAFTIWAWQKTGQPSALSTISFFAFLPAVALTPLAGAFVDRWNRKLVLALSDLANALGTLAALLLLLAGRLEIWHIYAIGVLGGFFTAFQYPAYNAAVATMLPKEDFTRAEGMLGLSAALSGILAPVFAASLLDRVEFAGIMTIDLLTFLAAFVTLAWIRVPQPTVTQVGRQSRGDLGQETRFGFRYIRERPSLAALAGLFMAANVFIAIGATLLAPLILSGTGNDQSALATVQSMGAIGGVIGGAILSVWGGPKRRIHGILLGGAGACLLGIAWLGWSRAILFWAVGSFFFSFFEPYVEGGNIALWQTKVEADVQGRVFSARQLLVQIPYLLGIFIAGPLAEQWSIPAVMIGAGVCGTLAFVAGYGARAIRNAETLLPDAARESE